MNNKRFPDAAACGTSQPPCCAPPRKPFSSSGVFSSGWLRAGVAAPVGGGTAAQAPGGGLPDFSGLSISWGGYFEALAILCFVLAFLWAVLWLMKRHKGGLFSGGAPGMRIETRMALGPKKWIVVARYLDRRLILGVTDERITMLTEMPVEEAPAEGRVAASPPFAAATQTAPAVSAAVLGALAAAPAVQAPASAGPEAQSSAEAPGKNESVERLFASMLRESGKTAE